MLPFVSRHPAARGAIARRQRKINAGILTLLVFPCAVSIPCCAESGRVLCREGSGSFSSQFSTGVTVSVGPSRNGAFATHSCDATLRWDRNLLPVAQGAWEADIDVMGADLGLGVPVVAFRVRNSELDHLETYEVFSLTNPPRLLRTITDGHEYDARDMGLRGRNEIWTDDVRPVDGFENLPLSSWDFSPTAVLRFEDQRLIDVSSEFQSYFDHQAGLVKSQLDASALDEFRRSDGQLSSSTSPMGDLHTLVRTKIKVLEIVWSYLSSGREQRAWSELAAMWPPTDLDRIRGAIQDARARGILRQVDGVSKPGARAPWKHSAAIFDCKDTYKNAFETVHPALRGVVMSGPPPPSGFGLVLGRDDRAPEPIYLGISFPWSRDPTMQGSRSNIDVNLVIDAAGKVQSAQLAHHEDKGPIGDKVLSDSADWNFIPGFRHDRPVACRMGLTVWPRQ